MLGSETIHAQQCPNYVQEVRKARVQDDTRPAVRGRFTIGIIFDTIVAVIVGITVDMVVDYDRCYGPYHDR